jgi:DNA-binding CsgD family transcriptional regulator
MSNKVKYTALYNSVEHFKKIFNPLQNLGVRLCGHDITFPYGEVSFLTSEKSFLEYYCKQEAPLIFTNETGRTLEPGIYLNSILEQESPYAKAVLEKVSRRFNLNNTLFIVEREHDCQHMYYFSFQHNKELDFIHAMINNIHLIRNQLEKYKSICKDLIIETKKKKNRLKFSTEKKSLGGFIRSPLFENERCVLHKDTGRKIYLSQQQAVCLSFLFQGKSSKFIAYEMNLSQRTVEHYLERIRMVLGCRTSKELISCYLNRMTSPICL